MACRESQGALTSGAKLKRHYHNNWGMDRLSQTWQDDWNHQKLLHQAGSCIENFRVKELVGGYLGQGAFADALGALQHLAGCHLLRPVVQDAGHICKGLGWEGLTCISQLPVSRDWRLYRLVCRGHLTVQGLLLTIMLAQHQHHVPTTGSQFSGANMCEWQSCMQVQSR